MHNNEPDKEILLKKLNWIEREMKKQNSLKRIIPQSIFKGALASFGATIVFGIILIILAQLIKSAGQIPILNNIIEKTKLEKVVDSYNDVDVNDYQIEEN